MGPKKNQPVKPTIAKLQNLDLGELTEETYIITKKRDIFFGEQRAKEIQEKLTAKRILTPMKEKTEPEPMKEKTEPQQEEIQQKRVTNAMQITPSKEGKKKFLLFFFLQYFFQTKDFFLNDFRSLKFENEILDLSKKIDEQEENKTDNEKETETAKANENITKEFLEKKRLDQNVDYSKLRDTHFFILHTETYQKNAELLVLVLKRIGVQNVDLSF
jgi:hypothetical protein